ncbi:replication protein A 32 kDa subunit B isoform X1 [Magnolia sinica]|uniref:replication protein A 32 kDa subunit B isoform X1 n=1 Tax=Magnolia sinica TaxID=86752 RepID=UPI00265B011C|nr:replication protein A 32 kDa subunit B isoform X1 [Magnolia sinica]
MFSSQYDGASLFSGGGFMPSQANQNSDSGFSPAKVTLVGMVINKVEKVTDVNFSLDDGTGRIDIHRWVNDAAESNEMAAVNNGMYVRVNGQLKGFQGKRQAVAFSVRPVTDFNEIAYHFIECIHVHQYNMRSQAQGGGPGQAQTNSATTTAFQNGSVGHQAAVPNQFASMAETGTDFDQMVLAIFHEPENLAKESGVHVDRIVERLGVPKNKIMQSINYHTDNGNIYSTIDDYHFKSTING